MSDVVAETQFRDVLGGDFKLERDSPARALKAGVRDSAQLPITDW